MLHSWIGQLQMENLMITETVKTVLACGVEVAGNGAIILVLLRLATSVKNTLFEFLINE